MQISFLAADDVPLTKRFALDNGRLVKHSYPHVRDFTSHTYEVTTPEEFYELTKEHAELGHCLLKGRLHRELRSESRAGSTLSADLTRWILLDLDGVTGFETADDFIAQVLPPCFHNVSYVMHTSASAGIADKPGLNCHLAFIMDRDLPAPYLKLFLEHLNFETPSLRSQLALSASACTLVYRLDITTCQNDKLIFISPPTLDSGLTDPLDGRRISLHQKQQQYLVPDFPSTNPALLQTRREEIIAELRHNAGLKAKTPRYKTASGVRYIANPDQAIVTGEQRARGFVYLNLNNGDSWAYYFPENNPVFLYSFKDPGLAFRLADIIPEYAAQFTPTNVGNNTASSAPIALIFRERYTDTYWNGFFYPDQNRHDLARTSSKDRLGDFAVNNGLERPKTIPDWTMEFDPTTETVVDLDRKWVNKFVPTEYMTNAVPFPAIPFVTQKVLLHALGGCPETLDDFINWLAIAFTMRVPTLTAWVITGVEGTGKGLLHNKIISKLFGAQYCLQKGINNLEDTFNDWQETCLMMNFNEARLSDAHQTSRVLNALKNMITEPTMTIRAMRTNQYTVFSHMNQYYTSNNTDVLQITPDDRRFHVAPRQEEKLIITQEEIDQLEAELMDFAGYLMQYPADRERAATVKLNAAKIAMQRASLSSVDQLFYAIQNGELEYFTRFLQTNPGLLDYHAYKDYEAVVQKWLSHIDEPSAVTHNDLYVVYSYLQADRIPKANKFTRLLTHHNITLERMRVDGIPAYALITTWHCEQDIIDAWLNSQSAQPHTA